MPHRPIILLLGPTAGGKTALAVALAQRLPGGGECVGADSMQVYRGMEVGTAKPTAAERAAVAHHLLDVADPAGEPFTVDRWLELAEAAIAAIRSRGRWPIVVGGTNLYVQALLKGLCAAPEPQVELRRTLEALDSDALHERLRQADPGAAERIHRNDRRRAIRAIEVWESSGCRLSDLQQQWAVPEVRSDAIIVGLHYPPEAINRRINRRVNEMVEAGLFEETAALHRAGQLGPQAREALGYRQVIAHIEGRLGRDEAVEQIRIATRRFAKQQRTWLRRFAAEPRGAWIQAADLSPEMLVQQALAAIDRLAGDPPPG